MVGERLGDKNVGELLNKDPLVVQELQVGHGEPPQVVRSETIERHKQQRRGTLPSHAFFCGRSSDARKEKKQRLEQHPEKTGQENCYLRLYVPGEIVIRQSDMTVV